MAFETIPGATVEVPEIAYTPQLDLPAAKSAVIVADMQNDFVSEGASLVIPAAADAVPNMQRLLRAARQAGVRVAYTQDTHFEGDPEWQIWPEHCRHGTWGWQIDDA